MNKNKGKNNKKLTKLLKVNRGLEQSFSIYGRGIQTHLAQISIRCSWERTEPEQETRETPLGGGGNMNHTKKRGGAEMVNF